MKNDRIIVEVRLDSQLDNQQNQVMESHIYFLNRSAWEFGGTSKTVAPSRRSWPFGLGIRTRGWTRPS